MFTIAGGILLALFMLGSLYVAFVAVLYLWRLIAVFGLLGIIWVGVALWGPPFGLLALLIILVFAAHFSGLPRSSSTPSATAAPVAAAPPTRKS